MTSNERAEALAEMAARGLAAEAPKFRNIDPRTKMQPLAKACFLAEMRRINLGDYTR